MANSREQKIYHTDYNGRSHADVKALLNSPKVKRILESISKTNEKFRDQPGFTILRRVKVDE